MADNTTLGTGSGGDTIATDELSTLNGGASSGVKAQRVKVGFGSDGDLRDVDTSNGLPMWNVPPVFMRVGFAEVGSGLVGLAATEMTLVQTGSGMAVNQSGGNLVITTGTTTNSETVIRSATTFKGSLLARYKAILSQRIANNTFRFELADQIGTALAYTINSSTSVTVTFPTTNPFTAANVGQSLRLSALSSVGIPGRYAIASMTGLTVTFTVAGWPGSGSGTLTLYGWNYIANEYSGTTATQSSFDAQRRGWASGATTATINTTASPGHVGQFAFDVHTSGFSDALVASNTGYQWTQRASRIENIPDEDVDLYLWIILQNGSTAPASTTTLTVGFVQVEDQGRQKVRIASSDPTGSHALPVQVQNTVPISGTVTAGTTTGSAAAGATATGNPVLTGAVAKTAQPTARTDNQVVQPLYSKVGHAITMVGQIRDLNDTSAVVTVSTTTETTLVAAVAAVFNDLYSLTLTNTSATGVRVDLRSVAAGTVLDSFWVPATTTITVNPAVPYKQATVNTAWTIQLSAAVTDVRASARTVRNI